ncbi:MAG: hypothetical protein K2M63_10955 [Muribaculaceae bacterium]|nr:hypothetical protein [Bacteroides sp.]MDE6228022.1 hypothetical protein [Muribaculaceae bacterium]
MILGKKSGEAKAAAETSPQHQGYEKVIPFTSGMPLGTLLYYITCAGVDRFKKEGATGDESVAPSRGP